MNKDSIGVGVSTCNRPEMLNTLLESLEPCIFDHLVIVNDGDSDLELPAGIEINATVIDNEKNIGVGMCKNIQMKHLLECQCEHIFLLEDDMEIVNNDLFEIYIAVAMETGVKHLNYCLHGEDNKSGGEPNPKIIVDYGDVKMSLYHNIYGALSYYHAPVLQEVGLMDEEYNNAMEHVDHTMQIIKAGYHPHFRWFADVTDSHKLLREQDNRHEQSVIRKSDEWMDNFKFGVERFYNKFDINVCGTNQPEAGKQEVIEFLKGLKTSHGQD